MQIPFRFEPKLPAHTYKTYAFTSPMSTHTRIASCRETECRAYAYGWVTTVDTNTPLGAEQANYIRLKSGRRFTVTELAGMASFTFPPGQRCFTEHRASLEREPLYVVRGGDWRRNTGLIRRHVTAADWVDDFADHQQSIADRVQKG